MKFSIIIPIHFSIKKEHIIFAIESVLHQSLLPFEIIIICDGFLSDDVKDFLYKDLQAKSTCNVRILKNEINLGPGKSRNIAVENATTEFIAFMDADDCSVSNRFELQINEFLNSDCEIIGGQIEEYNNSLTKFINKRMVPINLIDIKKSIKYRNTINNVTVMMKKNVFDKLGGYPDLFFGEDYVLWLKAIDNGVKIKNLNETLVLVRTNNNFAVKRLGFQNLVNNLKLFSYLKKSKSVGHFFASIRLLKILIMVILPNPLKKYIFLKFNR